MLSTAALFFFLTNQDPMNDAKTWEARAGRDRVGVSVLCGANTKGQVAVEFRVDQELRELLNQRTIIEFRFDDGEAKRAHAFWWGNRATLVGRDASDFTDQIQQAKRIRARFAGAFGDDLTMDILISDPSKAIGRVIKSCAVR